MRRKNGKSPGKKKKKNYMFYEYTIDRNAQSAKRAKLGLTCKLFSSLIVRLNIYIS